jgi:ABC-type glycerol-3-phosphate transport system substrate-binding protein
MPTRRLISLLSILMPLALLLASCGSPWNPFQPDPVAPVEIRLASFPGSGPWDRAEKEVIQQFNLEHPHITVHKEGYQQPIERYLAASPPPDVMLTLTGYVLTHAMEQEQLLDVTELWEEAGLLQNFPAALQRISQQAGKQYFVPVGYPWSAIYYNRAIFQELNLEPPQTWDEFYLLCEQLKASGITPLALNGSDPTVTMLWFDYLTLRLYGADFHRQLVRGQVPFDDPRVLAVLYSWRTLFANDYYVENPASATTLASLMALVRGDGGQLGGEKAAMTLIHSALLTELPAPFQAELDFFRFPILDPTIPLAEAFLVYGYMIPRSAEQLDGALAFAAHAASTESQALMTEHINSTVAVQAPANGRVDPERLPEAQAAGMALVAGAADMVPFFMFSLPDSMADRVSRALAAFLRNPDELERFAFTLEEARQAALAANLLNGNEE